MSAPFDTEQVYPRVHAALNALADWIKQADQQGVTNSEFHALEPSELQTMARDLGMSSQELRDVSRQGRDAALLLLKRMTALRLVPDDIARTQPAWVTHDLERLCSLCRAKGRCRRDLLRDPQDPVWKNYCPNSGTLEALSNQP